jgi:hypothetical protein
MIALFVKMVMVAFCLGGLTNNINSQPPPDNNEAERPPLMVCPGDGGLVEMTSENRFFWT